MLERARDRQIPLDAFGQSIKLERPRRIVVMLASLTAIAVMALASACYLWFNYDRSIEAGSSGAVAAVADPGAGVTLEKLQAVQQQTTSELEAMNQNIAATKAELQKLSDQVSALAAKVDALQKAPPSPSASTIARQPSKKPTQTPRPAPN